MPELPEVEITLRGIAAHVTGRRVSAVTLRRTDLRWPVPADITRFLPGQRIDAVERRAKYLLFHTTAGSALVHLGMSGMLRVLPANTPAGRHDHVDMTLVTETNGVSHVLRFSDPRRFGCLLWQAPDKIHPLLTRLGPEPFTTAFDGAYLWQLSRRRCTAVKTFLMDNTVVVGVGNIYANEALFAAGIDPRRLAGRIARPRYARLTTEVKRILGWAIERGGTTLRDFLNPDGAPGYFFRELMVYGRAGAACKTCGAMIRQGRIGQRATFWCPCCQR